MAPHMPPTPSSRKRRRVPSNEHRLALFEYFIMAHVAKVVILHLLYFVLSLLTSRVNSKFLKVALGPGGL